VIDHACHNADEACAGAIVKQREAITSGGFVAFD
jgi:hypothetical protein